MFLYNKNSPEAVLVDARVTTNSMPQSTVGQIRMDHCLSSTRILIFDARYRFTRILVLQREPDRQDSEMSSHVYHPEYQ